MRFSTRTEWEREQNQLAQAIDELKAKSIDIIDLTESNPTRCGFDYPVAIVDALRNVDNLSYDPDSRGVLKARNKVGEFCSFDPARIILTASTSESYGFLFRLLLNPGDKVLVPRPSYPLFQFLLELNDAAYDYYPLEYQDGMWQIDFDALEVLIDDGVKAIVVVNPNNPTGSYIKSDELKRLNEVCKAHGLVLISDEVFYDYKLRDGDFVSLKDNNDVLTFVLGGLSKSLCLPQMKLGWMLVSGPAAEVEEALHRLEIIADTYLSVNTPVQNALAAWLAIAPGIQAQVMARLRTNLETLNSCGRDVLTVEGGWYALIRMDRGLEGGDALGFDEETFVLDTLRRHHVLMHPGFFFDCPPGHLVVSLLPNPDHFANISKVLK